MTEILLGDTVECIYTGYKGTAIAKCEFINGCTQFTVVHKLKKGTVPTVETGMGTDVDSQSLKIVKKGPRHIKPKTIPKEKESTGGPSRISRRQRGY